MSILPDYPQQAVELIQQLEAQAMITAGSWSDVKREEFYDRYVVECIDRLECYIYGGDSMRGKGLNELLEFVGGKVDEFESEGAASISHDIIAPAISINGCGCSGIPCHQILAPADATASDLAAALPDAPVETLPPQLAPGNVAKRRDDCDVDPELNSTGNFSPENLRNILNKRINGKHDKL